MDTTGLGYERRYFHPEGRVHRLAAADDGAPARSREPAYVYTDDTILAVNVALATGRPLLVRGESGSGKSSLARNVADWLGWRMYQKVITSRTQARDLQWDVDLVRRLQSARSESAQLSPDYSEYIVPGVLWWAFDPASVPRGAKDSPQVDHERAVVLLDEIDKADPDVPNNLLEPLGSLRFTVDETGQLVAAKEGCAPLVFLTTNEERELPPAFLRRCVEVTLERPARRQLIAITEEHFPDAPAGLITRVADRLGIVAPEGEEEPASPLGTADFIDTVRATIELGVAPDGSAWDSLAAITAWKHGRRPDAR